MNDSSPGIPIKPRFLKPWMPTVLTALIVIVLALASWFLEPDYMAHVPIRIGVSAYDSVDAAPVLKALADLVREKGGGDISWVYLGADDPPRGCDFYLMTTLQYLSGRSDGGIKAVLVAKSPFPSGLSPGVVIARPGISDADIARGRIIFQSRSSASGFLSSYAALRRSGLLEGDVSSRIDFSGCRRCGEKVVFGVLFGYYAAGGLPLYEFEDIRSRGYFSGDDIEIRLTGPPVTEIVLAAERTLESWKESGFSQRLPVIVAESREYLRTCLIDIGIAGFAVPGEKTIALVESLADSASMDLINHRP